jgi:hypothetical protein
MWSAILVFTSLPVPLWRRATMRLARLSLRHNAGPSRSDLEASQLFARGFVSLSPATAGPGEGVRTSEPSTVPMMHSQDPWLNRFLPIVRAARFTVGCRVRGSVLKPGQPPNKKRPPSRPLRLWTATPKDTRTARNDRDACVLNAARPAQESTGVTGLRPRRIPKSGSTARRGAAIRLGRR